jgi:succinyl-CoA synthetase beta subunit
LSAPKLLVVPAVTTQAEACLSLFVDRAASKLVFVGCAEGGVDLEQTARSAPEKILRLELPAVRHEAPAPGEYEPFAGRLFPHPMHAAVVERIMAAMERVFRERDCSVIEINPLAVARDGRVLALNTKILFDDNALFRQPANLALRNGEVVDPAEVAARDEGLSFIGLDGNIGCMVNGAGLAMATLDTIKHLGGAPANFLDVGGSSSMRKIISGFEIILLNPRVNVAFINIFGGITRCDDVARGILLAIEENLVRVPIVIRLVGTNEQEGRALLAGRGLTVAETLEEGAQKAVEIGRQP